MGAGGGRVRCRGSCDRLGPGETLAAESTAAGRHSNRSAGIKIAAADCPFLRGFAP